MSTLTTLPLMAGMLLLALLPYIGPCNGPSPTGNRVKRVASINSRSEPLAGLLAALHTERELHSKSASSLTRVRQTAPPGRFGSPCGKVSVDGEYRPGVDFNLGKRLAVNYCEHEKAMTTARAEPKRSQPAGTEAALVARARLGDDDAMTTLIHAHAPRLRWVAWGVVRNWADADDVVQVTLWKAYQHLPDYQEQAPISTWLTRIALNEGVGLLRKRRTQLIDLAEPDAPLHEVQWPAPSSLSPEQILASNEIHRIVRRCMQRMRPDYRAVLCCRILDELGHDEIAQRLGLSVGAVKTRIHRARRVLQGMLRRRGAVPAPLPNHNGDLRGVNSHD